MFLAFLFQLRGVLPFVKADIRDLDALRTAAPDVIVSQTLCDVCAVSTGDVFAALEALPSKPTLIDLTPNTLDDVLNDCLRVGEVLSVNDAATRLVKSLQQRLDALAARTASIPDANRPRVGFLEWLLPPFNGGHWNPELVARAGGIDLFGAHGTASSTLDWDTIAASEPDALVIACCGFRTERTLEDVRQVAPRREWQRLPAVRNKRVYVMDGNDYFSCPSPRLVDALEIMAHALHPLVHPNLHPESPAFALV